MRAMAEDMRTLDQHMSLFEKRHKELVLYLLAANLAVQDYTGDGKNVSILKEQISSLRRSIRIYNQTSTDIIEYYNFLSRLVIHLNDTILKINYLFSKVNLPPLESNLVMSHPEHLSEILEDVSSLRNEVKEFFKK